MAFMQRRISVLSRSCVCKIVASVHPQESLGEELDAWGFVGHLCFDVSIDLA